MGNEGVIFALGNSVLAWHDGLERPSTIFVHPRDTYIYSLMLSKSGLLIGDTDIRNRQTDYLCVVPFGPVTSLFPYKEKEKVLAFAGWGTGYLFDKESEMSKDKVEMEIDGHKLPNANNGVGTIVTPAGERLFLANRRIFEIVSQNEDLQNAKIEPRTDELGDYPIIFEWNEDLYDVVYRDTKEYPKGSVLHRSLDRTLIASFPTLEHGEVLAYASASKSGDLWFVTYCPELPKDEKDPTKMFKHIRPIRVYWLEGLMGEHNKRVENTEASAEILYDIHVLRANPLLVVERRTLEEIMQKPTHPRHMDFSLV